MQSNTPLHTGHFISFLAFGCWLQPYLALPSAPDRVPTHGPTLLLSSAPRMGLQAESRVQEGVSTPVRSLVQQQLGYETDQEKEDCLSLFLFLYFFFC